MIYGERSKSIPRIYLRWVWASYTSYLRQAVCANGGLTFLRDLLSGIYASVVAWAVGSLAWRYAPLLLRRPCLMHPFPLAFHCRRCILGIVISTEKVHRSLVGGCLYVVDSEDSTTSSIRRMANPIMQAGVMWASSMERAFGVSGYSVTSSRRLY